METLLFFYLWYKCREVTIIAVSSYGRGVQEGHGVRSGTLMFRFNAVLLWTSTFTFNNLPTEAVQLVPKESRMKVLVYIRSIFFQFVHQSGTPNRIINK